MEYIKDKKTALVLGAGGFIGNHLVNRLKDEGYYVVGADLKYPEYQKYSEADIFIIGDLTEQSFINMLFDNGAFGFDDRIKSTKRAYDEIYQLAADMGGAGYIFSGENDANVMYNSAIINLNIANAALKHNAGKVFYSSSACFVGGTRVFTSKGFLPIEEITTDMQVIAEDGKWHNVTKIHKTSYQGDLVKVSCLGTTDIICTPDHRFLLQNGNWSCAHSINKSEIFEVKPDLSGNFELNLGKIDKYQELWQSLDDYTEPLYLLAEKYETSPNTPYKWAKLKRNGKFPGHFIDPLFRQTIRKTYELGWLLGIILSEGWIETNKQIDTQRLVIALGKHETVLIEKYKNLLTQTLGIHADRIIQYDSTTSTKIHVTSKRLVHLFNNILASIANGGHNKKMTMEGLTGPTDYRQGILDGANEGDGCEQLISHGNFNRMIWSSTSSELAAQYSILLKSLGLYNSIHIRPAGTYDIEDRTGTSMQSYHVYTKKNPTKIQNVEFITNQNCYVYNIDVEDVHSYIVEGCVVHNCMYPAYNQEDPDNPNCKESSAYPAAPDSEYGWEKLFSERLYLAYQRNHGLNVRIARFHNIFGPLGTWQGGKEKAPAAICRKVLSTNDVCQYGKVVDIWGDGNQTRSFLYIDECIEGIRRLMNSDFTGPVNIGSDEMVTINQLVDMAASFENKEVIKNHIPGPLGVRGRNSDNTLIKEKLGWAPNYPLIKGLEKTYFWIKEQMASKYEYGTTK